MNKKQLAQQLEEVEEWLKEAAIQSPYPVWENLQDYLGTRYVVLGLRAEQMKQASRVAFSFTQQPIAQQWEFWLYAWQESRYFEVLSIALLFIRRFGKRLVSESFLQALFVMVQRIDNWAHSDELSQAISSLLPGYRIPIWQQLVLWRNHPDPWHRRQSLVVIVRIRKHIDCLPAISELLPHIEALVADTDYFVQKGVGWALRDLALVYPQECLHWMENHHSELSAAAYATATERLSPELKSRWKENRKQLRKTSGR